MNNPFRRIRDFIFGRYQENGNDYERDGAYAPLRSASDNQNQLYTALDIGTAYAKALIIEVRDDGIGEVLGVGRNQQSYTHMSDGMVIDIPGVIANCNEALVKAEQSAGNIIAPPTVIGIAGELVKGSSTTITLQRPDPNKEITPDELENAILKAQQKLYKTAKERIATEIGYSNIEVRLTNAAVISVRIDGQPVHNPIGFRGRHFQLTAFSSFAPLMQLGALETVAKGLDLTLISIVAEPYALARCLSVDAGPDSGAIFIDIGGGTTDIALVRQGGIEETRMFALGGRTFTRRLSSNKGLSLKEAENLKLLYSTGNLKGAERDEVRAILAPEVQTWMDSIELLVDELAKDELLPPAIYMVGGGSALPDLRERLANFPWKDRLPFSRDPVIEIIQPGMVNTITDPKNLLKNAQDITPMALAYQAIELQDESNVLEHALNRVIHKMHI
jgi:cell division protein FtsA